MSETTEAPPPAAQDPAEYPVAVAADLRRRLNEATHARHAAERRAQEAQQQVGEARATAIRNGEVALSAQADAVTNAVTAGEARMNTLKRELTAAYGAGEYEKVSELQGEMSELGAQIVSARQEKARMEAQRAEQLRTPPPQQRQAAPPPADPFEQFVSTRTPATAEWLRKNREHAVGPDGMPNKKVQAAHLMAEDAGIPADTPEYFQAIEKHLGMHKPSAPAAQNPSNGQGGRRIAPAAAPSRGSDYGGGQQPRSSYISPEVVDRAEWMGITPQELQAGIDAEDRSGGWINGNPYNGRRG
jgi:hypothetical protein